MQSLTLVDANRAECPACKKDCSVRSHHPEKSGLWGHYFGKKCREFRKKSEQTFPDSAEIGLLIKQADNILQKRFREAAAKQKEAEAAAKRERHDRVHRKHTVTGGFLLDVADQLESALSMMEPYYSQCDADKDGREMVARLEEIIATKNLR